MGKGADGSCGESTTSSMNDLLGASDKIRTPVRQPSLNMSDPHAPVGWISDSGLEQPVFLADLEADSHFITRRSEIIADCLREGKKGQKGRDGLYNNIIQGVGKFKANDLTPLGEHCIKQLVAWFRDNNPINLAGADLSNTDLSGIDVRFTSLFGANLSGANLDGANLTSVDITSANLSGANLHGADLRGATARGANLSNANLTNVNLSKADFCFADLTGASLYEATLSRDLGVGSDRSYIADPVDFRAAILRDADLRGVNFKQIPLRGVALQGAKLGGAWIYMNEYHGRPDLAGVDLHGLNIADYSFNKQFDKELDFSGAILWSSKFDQCDLRNTKFTGAAFRYTSFSGANLDGVDFTGADLGENLLPATLKKQGAIGI